jgi:hypothetical protein
MTAVIKLSESAARDPFAPPTTKQKSGTEIMGLAALLPVTSEVGNAASPVPFRYHEQGIGRAFAM